MEFSDHARAELEYSRLLEDAKQQDLNHRSIWLERLNVCDFHCEFESTCPQWRKAETEDGYLRKILQCHRGFNNKPVDNPPSPCAVTKPTVGARLMPFPGEFGDIPEFEQRLGWLQTALNMGDLDGTPEIVLARDLRIWMQRNFPEERPIFLFSDVLYKSEEINLEENRGAVFRKINESSFPLKRELQEAMKLAGSETDYSSIWAEFCKLAEREFGCLIGYGDGVVKYRGSRFEKNSKTPDTIRRADLPDKMRPFRSRK